MVIRSFVLALIILLFFSGCSDEREQGIVRPEVVTWMDNRTDIIFHKIPKGPFTFGEKDSVIILDYDYYIMKYEVTSQQYVNFLNASYKDGEIWLQEDFIYKHFKDVAPKPSGEYYLTQLGERILFENGQFVVAEGLEQHPMIGVGWFGCHAFCAYYGYRLPNQEEWEKAARGHTGWDYPWGNDIDGARANYHGSGGPFEGGTSPVGFYDGRVYDGFQTKDSPSYYGLYDMSGNAWEYTADIWVESVPFHIGAGGGFVYHTAAMCNNWYRSSYGLPYPLNLDRCDKADGFRVVKDMGNEN